MSISVSKLAKNLTVLVGTQFVINPIIAAVVPRSRQPDVFKKLIPGFGQLTADDKSSHLDGVVGSLSCAYELLAGGAMIFATPLNSADYVGLALAVDSAARVIAKVFNPNRPVYASVSVEAGYAVAKAGWQAANGFYKAHVSEGQ